MIDQPRRRLPSSRLATLTLGLVTALMSWQATPEDIDIFKDPDNTTRKPNVLIVLDNSSNWSRQSQKWEDAVTQGQSEVRAIKTVINELDDDSINIGVMEHITQGSSTDADSGYVRHHIRSLDGANKTALSNKMDTIFANINEPEEKRNSGNPFGKLFWDVYNYLGGLNHSNGGLGTLASHADADAYSTNFSTFESPLEMDDECSRTIVIFLGNNVSSGPTRDDQATLTALGAAGGDTSDQQFANFTTTTSTQTTSYGYSQACYSSVASCTVAEDASAECAANGYDSCFCTSDAANPPVGCEPVKHEVIKVLQSPPTLLSQTTDSSTGRDTGQAPQFCKKSNQLPTLSCPVVPDEVQEDTPAIGQTTTTSISWSNCAYVSAGNSGCLQSNEFNWEPRGDRNRTVTETQDGARSETPIGNTNLCYAQVADCDPAAEFPADCSGPTASEFCECVGVAPGSASCPAATKNKYLRKGNFTQTRSIADGTFGPPADSPLAADEWTRFLRRTGVPVGDDGMGNPLFNTKVTTYTLDVFNAQQNSDFSAYLFNMARVGGGRYFQAKNEDEIKDALREIFAEVQAVNSAFASASLPVNATNRSQNENQVFIGTFRPDGTQQPRWYGNLKRYQLVLNGPVIELGDKFKKQAVNNQTGFISECATSFWTSDSGDYWSFSPEAEGACTVAMTNPYSDEPDGPLVEKGGAAEVLRKRNEKIYQLITAPDMPAAPDDMLGNYFYDAGMTPNRNIKTTSSGTTTTNFVPGLTPMLGFTAPPTEVINFTRGKDTQNEDGDVPNPVETRASIHGDVVHSRPQPVNFGANGYDAKAEEPLVIVYYGANDGSYRAVDAETGYEYWSFVAPEHYSKLDRLKINAPKIRFAGDDAAFQPKDYFFDGSTGVLQDLSNNTWIYPTQRRGGRFIYGFEVSGPTIAPISAPVTMWRTTHALMGQTWSRPALAKLNVNGTDTDVVIIGGGYDNSCEDNDSPNPCGAAGLGRGVYVINAENGNIIRHFNFTGDLFNPAGSIPADIALLNTDADAAVEFAYAADTHGYIYRINFQSSTNPALWSWQRVAYTRGGGRKFLFGPALVRNNTTVFVALGSGDREHPLATQYPYTTPIENRFYVFKDDLTSATTATPLNLDNTTAMVDATNATGCGTDIGSSANTNPRGWFLSLTANGVGEQVVTSAVITAGQVAFSTNRPTPAAATVCSTSLGEARGYLVNLFNGSGIIGTEEACGGSRSSTFVGGGLPPSPVVATVKIKDDSGNEIIKTILIGAAQRDGGVSTIISPQRVRPLILPVRTQIYWRNNRDSD